MLFTTTAVGFYVAVALFRRILELEILTRREFIIVLILAIISYILIHIKRIIYKKKLID